MATVPGNPVDDGGIPKELQPTWGDIVMATSIMDQQGKFRVAGDVVPFPTRNERWTIQGQNVSGDEILKADTRRTLSKALGGTANVLPITPKSGD